MRDFEALTTYVTDELVEDVLMSDIFPIQRGTGIVIENIDGKTVEFELENEPGMTLESMSNENDFHPIQGNLFTGYTAETETDKNAREQTLLLGGIDVFGLHDTTKSHIGAFASTCYINGRLDQLSDINGSNLERFVKSRFLRQIIGRASMYQLSDEQTDNLISTFDRFRNTTDRKKDKPAHDDGNLIDNISDDNNSNDDNSKQGEQ